MVTAPASWKIDHGGANGIHRASGSSACQMTCNARPVAPITRQVSCLPDGTMASALHPPSPSHGFHTHSATSSIHRVEYPRFLSHLSTMQPASLPQTHLPPITSYGPLSLRSSFKLAPGAISTLVSFPPNGSNPLRHSTSPVGRRPRDWPGAPHRSRGGVQESGSVRRRGLVVASGGEMGETVEAMNTLGLDALTFLGATVVVIPAFKALKASPILGFLLSGVILSQFELIRNVADVKALSELGILFLLFEMGLELSLERLQALAKYAFGIGLPQVLLTTLAFTAFELPPNKAIGTQLLELFFKSGPDLVNIRSVDEAIVIGAALSLSSSAFVLQLLAEKGELPTRFGSATLGILLLQDIAVVPLLVILPILENGDFTDENMFPLLAVAGLKALLGLGTLLVAGRVLLRRFFEVVAESRSPEAFVALCLLTVTGTSLLTQKLGFSDSLGAFLAGALLAETNYRTQVEADIRPFRGLLLGLFFVTTGTSIDFDLLTKEWPNVLALLTGLIAIKTAIITALGPRAGLTLAESVRTGLLLSQGGEFAFVVFSLANQLGVLPIELNKLLIIVVVLSMALTPLLDSVGRKLAVRLDGSTDGDLTEEQEAIRELTKEKNFDATEPVVIIGFGQMAQVLANFLTTPLSFGEANDSNGWPFVCFDLDPRRVKNARREGFPVLYGDGARPAVLQTAGITRPKAVVVMYTSKERSVQAVERLRGAWPGVPIYGRARDLKHLLELKKAGASDVVLENAEASLRLGSILLQGLGVMRDDVVFLRRTMRESMDQRAREAYVNRNGDDPTVVGLFQDKVQTILKKRSREGQNGALQLAEGSMGPDADDDPVGPVLRFDDGEAMEGGAGGGAGTAPLRAETASLTKRSSEAEAESRVPNGRGALDKAVVAGASETAASGLATAAGAVVAVASLPENGSMREAEAHASPGLDEGTEQSAGLAASQIAAAGEQEGSQEEEESRRQLIGLDDEEDERGISYCDLEADDYDGALNYESDGGASYQSESNGALGQARALSAGRRIF